MEAFSQQTVSDRPFRTQAIKKFLTEKSQNNCPDLVELYSHDMEVQVNVAQDYGVLKSQEYRGPQSLCYTNDLETWFPFRIPKNASSDPSYTDTPMSYDLAEHVESIGMTGWNWFEKRSIFVGYDFDSIIGHHDGLTPTELEEVRQRASEIPWVTVRKSTSGSGIHLYVFLDLDITVNNHDEHAAIARAVLGKMSQAAGYNFYSKLDVCGHVLWCYHRKMEETDGLTLLKKGIKLKEIPNNWAEHINVIRKRATRTSLPIKGSSETKEAFNNIISERRQVHLDEGHQRIIKELEKYGRCMWDGDRHLLVTHTYTLKQVHESLVLRGPFDTIASGSLRGDDHNCFCIPLHDGAFLIYRFGQIEEHHTWMQDPRGISYCYYNRHPNLQILAKVYEGTEREKGGYIFENVETALQVLNDLGTPTDIDKSVHGRPTTLIETKDGRIKIKIPRQDADRPDKMKFWEAAKDKTWTRSFRPTKNAPPDLSPRLVGDKEIVKHIVDHHGNDAGWVIFSHGLWNQEPLQHVKLLLKSHGYNSTEIEKLLGESINNCWTLVNRPFEPEYPGDRQWNRNSPQFKFQPSLTDDPKYPHWKLILDHCGKSLDNAVREDSWCKDNGLSTGADYLKCWIANLFQKPLLRLPYLFLYGEQNTGKSILHEALSLLFEPGYCRADLPLTNPSGFTGELAHAILCVVEETDLNNNRIAYNRIKDWVTSLEIVIHAKGKTPYQIPNATHWIQCANRRDACPIFPGDTRIVVMEVDAPDEYIPKGLLLEKLTKETPDFLSEVTKLPLPKSPDRLALPPIISDHKMIAMHANATSLELFIEEFCYEVPGATITVKEFYEHFINSLEPTEAMRWPKRRLGKEMPSKFPKGKMTNGAQMAFGNISFSPGKATDKPLYVSNDGYLRR